MYRTPIRLPQRRSHTGQLEFIVFIGLVCACAPNPANFYTNGSPCPRVNLGGCMESGPRLVNGMVNWNAHSHCALVSGTPELLS